MGYAIVINLDYDTNAADECGAVWSRLEQRMRASGFHKNGRLFTSEMPGEHACGLARQVVEDMNGDPVVDGKGIYNFLKEFYAYDNKETIDLLLPPVDSIQIDEA